jgi:hypothetical protein
MTSARWLGCAKVLRNLCVKCPVYMKSIFALSVLAVLLAVAPIPCSAMMGIARVSKARAKELGMELRLKANGTNEVWVELEFKTEGQFKSFSHVSLEIREGDKLLLGYAELREKRSSSGSVVVTFMANRRGVKKLEQLNPQEFKEMDEGLMKDLCRAPLWPNELETNARICHRFD